MTTQPEAHNVQEIFKNVDVDGNLTVGNITQIYQIVNNLGDLPKPTGFPQNIPSSNTDKFVGREQDLVNLHEQLQQNQTVAIAAVEGMGGVGKTELAIQYSLLHLQSNAYPGGICWLRARNEDLGLQVVQFAKTDLGLQPPDDLELPERVRWCWQRWQESNTLVILDDVKNYSEIKPYLPPQPSQFKVLITTRLKLDLAGSLFLEVLSESDALLLLAQLLGEEKVTNELATAKELCQRLGYLPLALQLVGQYLKKRRISLAEMLQSLESKGLGHASLKVNPNDPTWTSDIKNGVAAAFKLSWSELSESAQELGCALSLFALAPIPWSLVESAIPEQDPENLEDARIELENLHLLQGEDTYQLHQLIREFFSNKQINLAIGEEQKANFCQALVKIANDIPALPTRQDIELVQVKIPHLIEVAQNFIVKETNQDLIDVFFGLGQFYQGQGLFALAEPWMIKTLEAVKVFLGKEHSDYATSLNNLAALYRWQGKYEQAESFCIEALKLRKSILGEENPDYATSLNSLAEIYRWQGKYEQARLLYIEALELIKRILGEENPDYAGILNNLAYLYYQQGKYKQAEQLFNQTLKLTKHFFGEKHPNYAIILKSLASLYESQGKYKQAEPLYIQAVDLIKETPGESHPLYLSSLNSLAVFYNSQENYEKGENFLVKSKDLCKDIRGEEDVYFATILNNLGSLYYSQGRYPEAEPLYLQALKVRKQLLGEEHPDVANSLNNLATLYHSQGRDTEAEPLYLQALELFKRLLGEEHPDVASSLNNLAELYSSQGRDTEAEPLYLQALEISEKSLGVNHPNTIIIRENLKICRDNQT